MRCLPFTVLTVMMAVVAVEASHGSHDSGDCTVRVEEAEGPTVREDWASQQPWLHHFPHSINSLDDNSVDLNKNNRETKVRWERTSDLGSFSKRMG